MKQTPDPLWTAYERFSTWFKDRGKDQFLAVLQGLIGGGLSYAIIASSWRAGSLPPERPDGIIDVIAATTLLVWSIAALTAAIGIMLRARWGWTIEMFVVVGLLSVQIYVVTKVEWGGLASFEDWFRAIQAVMLAVAYGFFAVYAYRKAFHGAADNSGVHSASHESATTHTR